ncbi:peptide chain release factor N(5)-glutamine methyltransferase, partial [Candidatus Poribacteria bacterium]|nr:peptide chain release factor N(5)-glutamine methyltransferase [Candidatus Poribacteria bacterium]
SAFSNQKIENPRSDAESILGHVLKLKRAELYLNSNKLVNENELKIISQMAEKRLQRIPLQYILGYASFLKWEFKVNKNVLIPRPETELLVEHVYALAKKSDKPLRILDIGTGSGCIAICLAKLIADVKIIAIDSSLDALNAAKENAQNLDVKNKIEFIHMDIMNDASGLTIFNASFDIIVSNPPYVKHDEIALLSMEVQCEPQKALDGGADGLNFYRKIIESVHNHLTQDGFLALEIGCDQGEVVKKIIHEQYRTACIKLYKDYQGLDRIIIFNIARK